VKRQGLRITKKKMELGRTGEEATTALPWTPTRPQRKRTTKEHLEKRSGEKMWTTGFRSSWRKIETVVQDRAGWRQVVYDTPGVKRHKSSKSHQTSNLG